MKTGLVVRCKVLHALLRSGKSSFLENTIMKRQTYTPEIKERAVRMLIEALNDYTFMWSCHKKHTNETILTNIQD